MGLLLNLLKERRALTKKIIKEFHRHHSKGTVIHFKKWGGFITATIIDCYNERLRVQSHTGKRYWIELYDVLGEG